jgi:predicted MFS family arabinose efflux permease
LLPTLAEAIGLGGVGRALGDRNYRIYVLGNLFSVVGSWVQRVAVGWLTWELTESGVWLGVIAFADLLPTVVIGPFAGAFADRFDRLRLLMIAQSLAFLQALLLCGLTAMGWITIELLLGLTLYLGLVLGFSQPVRLALIPSLVRRENLSAAIAFNSILFNGARFVGPALAGVVIVWGGVAPAFAINALTFVALLLALSRVRVETPTVVGLHPGGILAGIAEGLGYALRHPGIAPALLLLAATALLARPFAELLPGFAADVFDRGVDGLAWLTSATGLGAMAGGMWLAGRRTVAGLTRAMVAHIGVLVVALLVFSATRNFGVAVAALIAAGFAMVVCAVGIQTLMQVAVDGAMRGRVLSLYGLVLRVGMALGALMMGLASAGFGLRLPVAVGAALCAIAGLWAVRRLGRLTAALESDAATPSG